MAVQCLLILGVSPDSCVQTARDPRSRAGASHVAGAGPLRGFRPGGHGAQPRPLRSLTRPGQGLFLAPGPTGPAPAGTGPARAGMAPGCGVPAAGRTGLPGTKGRPGPQVPTPGPSVPHTLVPSARWALFVLGVVLILLAVEGCASVTVPGTVADPSLPAATPHAVRNPAALRAALVEAGKKLVGKPYEGRAVVRDKAFVLDCVGFLSATWWDLGFDLRADFAKYQGNAVSRMVASLDAWGALDRKTEPKPGDFVVWDNTWDRNEDGVLYNDGPTHAGLVVSVDEDGTVGYLHASVSRGIVLAFLNLRHPGEAFGPGNKVWNSPMMLGAGHTKNDNPPRWLSGDLWSGWASALRVGEVLPRQE